MSLRTIRFATPDDAATLAAFGARTFRDAFAADNRAEDMDAYVGQAYGETQQRRELEDPNQAVLLVERDGVLLAYAHLRISENEVEIARFYVDRAHHGEGIAQELMQHAIDVARERGAKRVWLGVWERNPRAIRFYEKCGFVDFGSHPFLIGSDLQTDRLMALVIDGA
ncbi:MAG TPA: GNAT family N-acetyltransferase [Thermoanaerobaculia bacterium]